MRRLRFAVVAAATSLCLAACGGGGGGGGDATASGAPRGGTLTVASYADPGSWDPATTVSSANAAQFQEPVYDTLIRLDPKANPTPNLATAWKWDDTKTRLTLTLRPGVKFTDGTLLDAAAVRASVLHTKSGANEAASALKDVKSVDVVDDRTVKITLAAPDPSFLAALGKSAGMIVSSAAIKDGTSKTKPVGSGPYQLSSAGTTAGSVYTYVRNPSYWNTKAFPFDRVVIKVMQDQTARENALRSGQLDATFIAPGHADSFRKDGFRVTQTGSGEVDGVFIWDRAGTICKPLEDVRVRQAINYAFDRTAIAKQLDSGTPSPTEQFFNPDSSAYDPGLNNTYPYDPARAKRLLSEAGYPAGFTCDSPDFSAFYPQAQAAMTQYLTAVGINLNPKQIPAAQLIDAMRSGQVAIGYFRVTSGGPWSTVQATIARDAVWNPFRYGDATADKLISDARNLTGTEQERAFKDLNSYTVKQAWGALWTTPQTAYVTSKKISFVPERYTTTPPLYAYSAVG